MIKSKADLKYYLFQDALARGQKRIKKSSDIVWELEKRLRFTEYYLNTRKPIRYHLSKRILYKLCVKTGITVFPNCFGPGLNITHFGSVTINGAVRAGKNCKIQNGVVIGQTNGDQKCPSIGDNCFFGAGCKIIGNIKIADNVAIGANAVVVNDIEEAGTTWAGIPAHKISNNSSKANLSPLLFPDHFSK